MISLLNLFVASCSVRFIDSWFLRYSMSCGDCNSGMPWGNKIGWEITHGKINFYLYFVNWKTKKVVIMKNNLNYIKKSFEKPKTQSRLSLLFLYVSCLPASSMRRKILIMKFPDFLTKLYAYVQYSSNFLNKFPSLPPITNAISFVSTNGARSKLFHRIKY